MKKHSITLYRGILPKEGRREVVSDAAVRINLVGALFFTLMIFMPSNVWELRNLIGEGWGDLLANLLVVLVGGSVFGAIWFFLVNMFCGMAGGGRGGLVVAGISSGVAVGLFLLRLGMIAEA